MKTIFFIIALFLLPAGDSYGHEPANDGQEITINEKLGSYVPADIAFFDEDGNPVVLKDLLGKPTVIAPVYLSCTNTCPVLLLALADVIGKVNMQEGKDYRVLAVSFDERDTPQLAAQKKQDYLKAINRPFTGEAWKFLTGSQESIRKFMQAVGFQFQPEEAGFSHPVTLIFLAPDGKIVRYLNGATFLPFEFELAVTEASKGEVVSIARKALLYCMSYDPKGKRYVFNILKVVATLMVVTIVSFFTYLVVTGRRYRREPRS